MAIVAFERDGYRVVAEEKIVHLLLLTRSAIDLFVSGHQGRNLQRACLIAGSVIDDPVEGWRNVEGFPVER